MRRCKVVEAAEAGIPAEAGTPVRVDTQPEAVAVGAPGEAAGDVEVASADRPAEYAGECSEESSLILTFCSGNSDY